MPPDALAVALARGAVEAAQPSDEIALTSIEAEDATPPALPAPDPFEGTAAAALAAGATPVLPKAEPPPA
ncbi:MAG: hypothetical protein EXR68_01140 [Dehalococcoidia bacterium]|nr:hypothetical protein [Dehalococcoidia bacterium]